MTDLSQKKEKKSNKWKNIIKLNIYENVLKKQSFWTKNEQEQILSNKVVMTK